jgi:hypothetical protein
LLVSMCLRRCFSFLALRVAAALGASRTRFAPGPGVAPLFLLAGASGASGASASDAASGFVLPECGTRVRVRDLYPRGLRAEHTKYKSP